MAAAVSALSCRELLPFAWQPASPEAVPSAARAEQNLRALAAVTALGERPRVDPDAPAAVEIERLHHKFDLMIEMLGALLRTAQARPEPTLLQLGAAGVAWRPTNGVPAPGSTVDVTIYLHACAPEPLRWPARVLSVDDGQVQLQWLPMPEALASAFEQYVFIRHRRSVADARSPAQRGESAARS